MTDGDNNQLFEGIIVVGDRTLEATSYRGIAHKTSNGCH